MKIFSRLEKLKKFFSILLSIMLIVPMFSTASYAENSQDNISSVQQEENSGKLEKKLQELGVEKSLKKHKEFSKDQKEALIKKLEKIKERQYSKEIKDQIQAYKKEEQKDDKKNLANFKKINEDIKQNFDESINSLLNDEEKDFVQGIEPNYLFDMQSNDPLYSQQWGLQTVLGNQPLTTTGNKKIVAVIDTGIDYTHEDLNGNFWTSENCVDDLGNPIEGGCTKGGYDFVDNDNDPFPTDNYSHGTAVAGIVGASSNNNLGMGSVTGGVVNIMALRACCTVDGFFELNDIVRAIYFAVNNGASVINMSFGGPVFSQQLLDAIEYAKSHGVAAVAAAGNYGMNNDTTPIYPASYDVDNVLSVAALTPNNTLASFSNYGANSVDIAAPGYNILSSLPNNTYKELNGTSFSAPFVSGILASNLESFSQITGFIPSASADDPWYVQAKNALFGSIKQNSELAAQVKDGNILQLKDGTEVDLGNIDFNNLEEVKTTNQETDLEKYKQKSLELNYYAGRVGVNLRDDLFNFKTKEGRVAGEEWLKQKAIEIKPLLIKKMAQQGLKPQSAVLLEKSAFEVIDKPNTRGEALIKYNYNDKIEDIIEVLKQDSDIEGVGYDTWMPAPESPRKIEETAPFLALAVGGSGYSPSSVGAPIIVAVIDYGVDYNHPALAPYMWDGTNCVDENGDPLGGCIHGYDFGGFTSDNNPSPLDQSGNMAGHGTSVAGVIAEQASINGANIKIMALKVSPSITGLSMSGVNKAIDFATHNGARVINASFAMDENFITTYFLDIQKNAIKTFRNENNGLFIAAAGNGHLINGDWDNWGYNIDNNTSTDPLFYPCAHNINSDGLGDNIICVGAMDAANSRLHSLSNYGSASVDIAAIGEDVYTTGNNNSYVRQEGTSFASPQVAGLAARILSGDATQDYLDLKTAIYSDTYSEISSFTGNPINTSRKIKSLEIPYHFSDVPHNAWYRQYIQYLAEQNVIQGYSDNTFQPTNAVNRAEVLKMAYEASKTNTGIQTGSSGFVDVNESDWFYKYVKHAKTQGYITGKDECVNQSNQITCSATATEKCFCGSEPVTRYEAAKMIHAVFTQTNYTQTGGSCSTNEWNSVSRKFLDVAQSDWYCKATHWMRSSRTTYWPVLQNIASGYKSGYFAKESPSQPYPNDINRAEISKIISNAIGHSRESTILPQGIELLAVESTNPEAITAGELYEQSIDSNNVNGPGDINYPGSINGAITIQENESLPFNFATQDSDGDTLFYFWSTNGGNFSVNDTQNYSSVTWIPPQVTEDTTFTLSTIRGDGRGLIGEGKLKITVQNVCSQTLCVNNSKQQNNAITAPIVSQTLMKGHTENINWDSTKFSNAVNIYYLPNITNFNPLSANLAQEINNQTWLSISQGVNNAGGYSFDPSTLNFTGNTYFLLVDAEGHWDVSDQVHIAEFLPNVTANFTSIATGGRWNNPATWGNRSHQECTTNSQGQQTCVTVYEIPGANDSVAINGVVELESNTTVKGVIVNSGATLKSYLGTKVLTITDDLINNGEIKNLGSTYIQLSVQGDIQNNATLTPDSINVFGNIVNNGVWKGRAYIGQNFIDTFQGTPLDGESYLRENITVTRNFSLEALYFQNHTVNVPLGKTLTVTEYLYDSGVFQGLGTVQINGLNYANITGNVENIIFGTATITPKYLSGSVVAKNITIVDSWELTGTSLTADNILFTGAGSIKKFRSNLNLNGNVTVASGVILEKYNIASSYTVTINGKLTNAGKIRNLVSGNLTLNVSGDLENTGELTSLLALTATGTAINSGSIIVTSSNLSGSVTNNGIWRSNVYVGQNFIDNFQGTPIDGLTYLTGNISINRDFSLEGLCFQNRTVTVASGKTLTVTEYLYDSGILQGLGTARITGQNFANITGNIESIIFGTATITPKYLSGSVVAKNISIVDSWELTASSITADNIVFTGTGTTKIFRGNLNLIGNVTIETGVTIDKYNTSSSYTITVNGSLTNAGRIRNMVSGNLTLNLLGNVQNSGSILYANVNAYKDLVNQGTFTPVSFYVMWDSTYGNYDFSYSNDGTNWTNQSLTINKYLWSNLPTSTRYWKWRIPNGTWSESHYVQK